MKIDRRQSTAHQIYENLHRRIIDMSLKPGEVISKQDVAARFGVSPSPVRDALLQLQTEGLVDIVPQSKTLVSLIDVQDARELHFLRLSVEVEVVKTLCKSITVDQLRELRVWNERLVLELKTGNIAHFRQTDTEFHEKLYALAGVPGLAKIISMRRGHYDRIRGLFLAFQERQTVVIEEHNKILDAIEARDPAAAELSVRTHLGKSLAIVSEIREQNPTYFLKDI